MKVICPKKGVLNGKAPTEARKKKYTHSCN